MNGIVLGALAVMWIVVLSWEGIQSVREGYGRRGDSMVRFQRQLDLLSKQPYQMSAANRLQFQAGGAPLRRHPRHTPTTRYEAARRRRDVVFALGMLAAAAAAGFAVSRSSLSLWLLIGTAALFGAYGMAVIRRRQLAAERAAKVRYLPSAQQNVPAWARRRVD